MRPDITREFSGTLFSLTRTVLACLSLFAPSILPAAQTLTNPAPRITNAFFAMDTGTRGLSPEQTASTLQEIGYAGLGSSSYDIKGTRKALEARGLKLFNVYLTLRFDPTNSALTPAMKQLITDLDGSGAALWIAVEKVWPAAGSITNSSPRGDAIAVARLREVADFAEPRGVKIALYPHTWFWLERTSDAVRLANQLDRPGVGATFNLCHWLKVEGDVDPAPALRAALPRLFFVSINGADGGDTQNLDWKRLIQPLDQGNYRIAQFLQTLRRLGYSAPIGLQAYGIPGEPRENLQRSFAAWTRFSTATSPAPPENLRFIE